MSVLFSKVALLADDCESTVGFLVCGIPQDEDDLKGYLAYDDFVGEHAESECFDVEVESYIYGTGETQTANEYEIAAFAQRGEDFLNYPDLQIAQKSSFEIMRYDEKIIERTKEMYPNGTYAVNFIIPIISLKS